MITMNIGKEIFIKGINILPSFLTNIVERYEIINLSIPLDIIKKQNNSNNIIFLSNSDTPKVDILINYR